MCLLGTVGKAIAKVAPFGGLGLVAKSMFGKNKTKTVTVTEPFNNRGSYTDPATGNTVVPAEVVAAQRASATGVAPQSLFRKG